MESKSENNSSAKKSSDTPQAEGELNELVGRLERIAKMNDDSFRYFMTLEPSRKGIVYVFNCEETADGHTFLCGSGATIQEAAKRTGGNIESACDVWGYGKGA